MQRATINFKYIVTSLAIAVGVTSFQPVKAQSYPDEVSEIGWSSRLSSMGLDRAENIGKTYDFYCQPAPEELNHAPIWGTNTYTVNSGICSTAVHAGMISTAGGTVSLELREGREFYTGSNKNDVESEDRSGTDLSFAFVGEPVANDPDSDNNQDRRNPSGIEKVMVNTVQRGIERSIEKAIIDIFD